MGRGISSAAWHCYRAVRSCAAGVEESGLCILPFRLPANRRRGLYRLDSFLQVGNGLTWLPRLVLGLLCLGAGLLAAVAQRDYPLRPVVRLSAPPFQDQDLFPWLGFQEVQFDHGRPREGQELSGRRLVSSLPVFVVPLAGRIDQCDVYRAIRGDKQFIWHWIFPPGSRWRWEYGQDEVGLLRILRNIGYS